MVTNILDKNRQRLLPKLAPFKDRFYLAGGTALALQIGHRKSIDFDFFTEKKFNETRLKLELLDIFKNEKVVMIQEAWQTIEIMVNGVKLSFFYLPYPLLEKTLNDKNLRLASIVDIGCMKLNTIISRSVNKDFVDLYYIFKQVSLSQLLQKAKEKMPELNENLVLKSLVYFDELEIDPLEYLPGKAVDIEEVKKIISKIVFGYTANRS